MSNPNNPRNAGRKPKCECGNCGYCKLLKYNRNFYRTSLQRSITAKLKAKPGITDVELTEKLIEKFKKKGWD